jgi:hypothetical protein
MKMTSIKRLATALTLGLVLALSAVAFGQNGSAGNGDKKESCCAMTSCCCKGDSCSMKEGKEGKDGKAGAEHSCCKGDKSAAKKDGRCCGDSCDMKDMKDMKPETKPGQ